MAEDLVTRVGMAAMIILVIAMAATIAGIVSLNFLMLSGACTLIFGFLRIYRKRMEGG